MNIYTKGGDKGTTSLVHTKNVSKSDDRIQLVGTIDELTSHLGLVKTMLKDEDTIQFLEKIQRTLITVMAGVADPYKRDYRIDNVKTEYLEDEINRMEGLFQRPKEFILPGKCRLSAEMDVARTVARRAERALATVSVKFGADNGAKKYMNRLADYLYILARYTDAKMEEMSAEEVDKPTEKTSDGGKDEVRTMPENQNQTGAVNEAVIQEVLKRMGIQGRITLASAKRLIEKIEQPGGTFYGVDKMDNGKIVIFGGGVPLKVGDTIIGGLGISGGTGEEDHSLAEYGLSVLNEVL